MWKNYLLGITLLLSVQILDAQYVEPCASHQYLNQLEEQYPGFEAANNAIFERNHQQIGQARDLTLLTIPVVIHIVYQNEDQNISDETIENIITSLNKDYRRLNNDANEIRSEFEMIVGDPFIEFNLAGIERVSTNTTFQFSLFGGLPDHVKKSTEGGSDAWDNDHFLNIWVCNIEGGALLGYAYPPAGLDHWPDGASAPESGLDGVVIHYEAFRTSGTYTTSGLLGLNEITIPIRGRSVTHEVGHYLGLRHIWGDGTLAILGIPDCNADDGVEDTPNQGLNSQFQCEPSLNTCNDGADDLPDMFENFMDYALEDCQNSFTNGQIEIMRSVLENERAGLVEEMVATNDFKLEQPVVRIAPNPVNNQLFVKIAASQSGAILRLNLIDQHGRQLENRISSNLTEEVIDVRSYPAGIYYLQAIYGDGEQMLRFVIQ